MRRPERRGVKKIVPFTRHLASAQRPKHRQARPRCSHGGRRGGAARRQAGIWLWREGHAGFPA